MNHKKPSSVPGIYLITNITNGKVYVGQARNISKRWHHHRYHLTHGTHGNPHLQRSWNKSGEAAFRFNVALDLSGVPKFALTAELNLQEALVFADHPITYNLLRPGLSGHTAQPETLAKLSAASRAMWRRLRMNPTALAAMIERANAHRRTPEARRAFSATMKTRWSDPVYHAALTKLGSEKWRRPGFRENHTAHLGAAWADPAKREQRVSGLKAAWANPKIRADRLEAIRIGQAKAMEDPNGKMRLRPKKRWAAPDAREKQADKSRETWADPAIKAKRCAALKAAWVIRRARLAAA